LATQDDTYHTYIRRSTRVPPSCRDPHGEEDRKGCSFDLKCHQLTENGGASMGGTRERYLLQNNCNILAGSKDQVNLYCLTYLTSGWGWHVDTWKYCPFRTRVHNLNIDTHAPILENMDDRQCPSGACTF
jgi:hypothetical protein